MKKALLLVAYPAAGVSSAIRSTGFRSAAMTSADKNTRNTGFSILPIQVIIPLGFREKAKTTAKKTKEKMARYRALCASPISPTAPTEKEVLAHRGMANSGPMVRYSRVQKKVPYFFPTLSARDTTPSHRLMPKATTASMGMPTAVINTPRKAIHRLLPASMPIFAGKIRLPAPKNMPNSILVMVTVSFAVRLRFMNIILSSFHGTILPHFLALFKWRKVS